MPFTFDCPACGRQMNAPDSARGASGKCRFCGALITAPADPGRPATFKQVEKTTLPRASGRVDLGAVVMDAWELLKLHWGALCIAQLITGFLALLVVLPILVPIFIHQVRLISNTRVPLTSLPGPHGIGLLFAALAILLQPLAAGPLYVAARLVTHGEENIALVFEPFRHLGAFLQFSLIYNLPILALEFVTFVFSRSTHPLMVLLLMLTTIGLWALEATFIAGLRPGLMEIVDKGSDGLTAAMVSWEFTKGHRLMILATTLVLSILASVGSAICCILVLFTMGFDPLGQVLIYRQLRGLESESD